MASQIEGNITALGFQLSDVKILINSHAHIDHGGGMGELKMATGAKLVAMARTRHIFENGGHNDALFGDRSPFPSVYVDRVIHDGDKVKLGDTTLTAYLTPGHTPGNTTWTMIVKDSGKSYNTVFFGIVTPFPNTVLTVDSRLSQYWSGLGAHHETVADAALRSFPRLQRIVLQHGAEARRDAEESGDEPG